MSESKECHSGDAGIAKTVNLAGVFGGRVAVERGLNVRGHKFTDFRDFFEERHRHVVQMPSGKALRTVHGAEHVTDLFVETDDKIVHKVADVIKSVVFAEFLVATVSRICQFVEILDDLDDFSIAGQGALAEMVDALKSGIVVRPQNRADQGFLVDLS